MSIAQINLERAFETGLHTSDLQSDNTKNSDGKKIHWIYDRLLFHLENKQIRSLRTKEKLPFILHGRIKSKLPQVVFRELENSVRADALNMTDYEIIRDSPAPLYYELKRLGDEELIVTNRIVAVPNFVLNRLVCEELEKEFSESAVLSADGFALRDGRICLDLDEDHARRGFLVPVIGKSLIRALKVFRYPRDEKPFILRSRSNQSYSGAIN